MLCVVVLCSSPFSLCTPVCHIWKVESVFIVQITSNLTFTRACSQNPRECASSTRERAYIARERKYYTRLYVHASREWRARANIASGNTIRVRMGLACVRTPTRTCAHALVRYSRSRARTHTVLASAALTSLEHSLHPHELSAREC